VLSVMGGFEFDLRQKILGTNAQVIVTKPKQALTEYRQVLDLVSKQPEVRAYSPFIESEVMVTSQTNLSGVLLRGIDPSLIGKVTDLPRYLRAEGGAGKLEDLLHPERLAKMPEAHFRPMVTPPLGEPPGSDGGPSDGGPAVSEAGPRADAGAGDDQSHADAAPEPIGSLRRRERQLEELIRRAESEIGKPVPPRIVYPGIIIGAELAKNLRLYLGDDVNVVAPLGGMSPAGPIPKSKPFRVAGIFYSGMYEYDTKFAYVTIPAAQRFLGMDDEVTGVEIKATGLEEATPLAESLRAKLSGRGFEVQDWKQMNRSLFTALRLEKFAMFLLLTFIVVVAVFSIVTNLTMVVLSKSREMSALKTMGVSHLGAVKIFFFAGIYIGTIGMLVGVLSGVGTCLFISQVGLPLDPEVYYISELPVRLNPVEILLVSVAGVGLSFFATLYPSYLAARLKPAEGLRRYET
jgi:lipoprotein-releasing system permease protein